MKRTSRKPSLAQARDPLFNRSVEKALAILEAFGGERRALSLAELAASVGVTTSSAQRCVHTLVRLGFLRRDPQAKRWVLTARALALAHAYLAGHALLEQATTHLIDLNQASGESVSLSEPDGTNMVFIARFPSLKRFYIHMPVGRRLPMYCTASGRAYLSALPAAQAQRLLRRSRPQGAHSAHAHRGRDDPQAHPRGARGRVRLVGPGVLPGRSVDRGPGARHRRPAAGGGQHLRAHQPLDAAGAALQALAAAAADSTRGLPRAVYAAHCMSNLQDKGMPELSRSLQSRHITMISIGGMIGAGLFVSSSAAIAATGPAIVISYLITGTLVLLVMRMLGEMAMTLPHVRSFTEFARAGLGSWGGFVAGWLYWYFWMIVVPVEAIAGANILHAWLGPTGPSCWYSVSSSWA